ncbi:hypothetical protein D3C87_2058370 [compost metagenome]
MRLVVPSACWKASNMLSSLAAGMPIPVSLTARITSSPLVRIERETEPCSAVNLTALDNRLFIIC